ncbi:hypothetical protein CCICO_11200 [Corynebacterium ciconiae DSM 44920]|uniref:hypothetical protein n=1 Tax=Corynebacterium ciconiae TaxID=227319 RepID=UPI000379825B|nr:hypothetical protein [Corynebacterium ciconiae]WKD62234.1 hypothetical protein CCICO_11200 [Corynebacterium ciconiae DSM 44920]
MSSRLSRLAALCAAATLAVASIQPAHAAPTTPPVDLAQAGGVSVDTLLDQAHTQSTEVQQALMKLMEKAEPAANGSGSPAAAETKAVQRGDVSTKSKFFYPAPVVGCGVGDLPVTGALATVQPGPNYGAGPVFGKGNLLQPYIPEGHAYFHIFSVDDRLAPSVKGTDMKVVWLNLATFKGGIAPLDESFLGLNVHAQTSALVETGPGPVIAAIAGKTAFGGDSCTVLPTVGATTVS